MIAILLIVQYGTKCCNLVSAVSVWMANACSSLNTWLIASLVRLNLILHSINGVIIFVSINEQVLLINSFDYWSEMIKLKKLITWFIFLTYLCFFLFFFLIQCKLIIMNVNKIINILNSCFSHIMTLFIYLNCNTDQVSALFHFKRDEFSF